jgi:hypothetical protein
VGAMGSMRWGGRQAAIRSAGEPPAPLVDIPMMGPAQQRQIREVGGAIMQPVAQMMRLTPGQRPRAVREHAPPVPHGQGGPLGGLGRPGWPARRPTAGPGPRRGPGSRAIAARNRPWSPATPLGSAVTGPSGPSVASLLGSRTPHSPLRSGGSGLRFRVGRQHRGRGQRDGRPGDRHRGGGPGDRRPRRWGRGRGGRSGGGGGWGGG